jgi:hypothetical protein
VVVSGLAESFLQVDLLGPFVALLWPLISAGSYGSSDRSAARNDIEMQLDGKFLYRTEVVDGNRRDPPKIPHKIPDGSQFISISLDVLPNILVQRYSLPGKEWQVLDSWDRSKSPPCTRARRGTSRMVSSDSWFLRTGMLKCPASLTAPSIRALSE